MDDAVKVLDDIGIPYQLRDITTKLDLSSCFKDGWSSNFSRFVLDFICGSKSFEIDLLRNVMSSVQCLGLLEQKGVMPRG